MESDRERKKHKKHKKKSHHHLCDDYARDKSVKHSKHAFKSQRCGSTDTSSTCSSSVTFSDKCHKSATTSSETRGHNKVSISSERHDLLKVNEYRNAQREHSNRDESILFFEFSNYKTSLNKIFFRDDDYIKKGTKEYNDFWPFLEKYQQYQRKKFEQGKSVNSSEISNEGLLELPRFYDKRYRINVGNASKHLQDFMKKGRLIDADIDKDLSRDKVEYFSLVVLHYIDFLQKQKFSKLKKIKSDQENLPIFQYKDDIVDMIKKHQVVVVAGDTGCGKSTQVPQYLLAAGFSKIACTQPRKIACVSLSKRVGYETLNEYGSKVAYQVRFEKTKTLATRILFLTEGLLLRQMTSDPHLTQYDVIVIDEVHERHIHTDFLLGVIKCLLFHRKDLKLVLMSATINIHLFSNYFDDAPVLQVPGRLYPIHLEYCPINKSDFGSKSERLDPSPYLKIMQRIDHKYPSTERGDLLIFLSGMTEIMTVCEAAKAYAQNTKKWIVLPLHSALSINEQDKVFDIPPEGVRKCIVSTNIAETSVTIDGVRFIADSGKVKEMSFDPKYKMQKLKEFWISRASAEQRKGRAGRTGPGVCFRLYTESDYEDFQQYSTPEIQRVPLDSLILQMISMGLPDARKFPFLEPPDYSSIDNSVIFLREQGALKEDETLTPIGDMLSRLPVEVVLGKMLIMGSIFHMIDPVLTIAAAMSVQSPFTSRAHTDQDSIAARKSLESEHGDPFTLLNAYDEWIEVKAEGRGTRKWCKRRGLEEQRFYEISKLKQQFKSLLEDHHLIDKMDQNNKPLTSYERKLKHAERKRLSELKRQKTNDSKKRKVLKMDDEDYIISDGEDDDHEKDIKDLEFRLSHDLNQLQEVSNRSRNFSRKDINLLKIILCSGLYPHVAMADDCNTYKSDSEQAFHTKNKPFILLHPTSVFGCHPDLLKGDNFDEDEQTDPAELRGKLSSKHELLTYVFLLETNKPYLMNTMRVPALQTITLFSNFIDTNASCTRLVCDGWLEIRFPDEESAQEVISSIIQLRSTWQNLLLLRLEDTFQNMDSEKTVNPRARKLEKVLATKLSEFLSSKVRYALRRILAAELKLIYKGPQKDGVKENNIKGSLGKLFGDNRKENLVKGGWLLTDYLTFDCLIDDSSASVYGEYTSHMVRHWTCPRCKQNMIASMADRLSHEAECHSQNLHATKEEIAEEEEEEKQELLNPLRKPYFCPECEKTYQFTMTEILKHKKTHFT